MDSYLEICYSHVRAAHEMLSRCPDHAFLVEQGFLMERFFAEYPSLAEVFRRYVAEGRPELSPGTYTSCDMNIPSGESLLRQALVGRRWCEANLGCGSRVMNLSDCTGSTAQLPQMAKLCGHPVTLRMHRQLRHGMCDMGWPSCSMRLSNRQEPSLILAQRAGGPPRVAGMHPGRPAKSPLTAATSTAII